MEKKNELQRLMDGRKRGEEEGRKREFQRLLAATGWSQAEASRRLKHTPGYLSQLVHGKRTPSENLLDHLRMHLGLNRAVGEQPNQGRTVAMIASIEDVQGSGWGKGDEMKDGPSDAERLAEIKEADAETYRAIKHMIDMGHRPLQKAAPKK